MSALLLHVLLRIHKEFTSKCVTLLFYTSFWICPHCQRQQATKFNFLSIISFDSLLQSFGSIREGNQKHRNILLKMCLPKKFDISMKNCFVVYKIPGQCHMC